MEVLRRPATTAGVRGGLKGRDQRPTMSPLSETSSVASGLPQHHVNFRLTENISMLKNIPLPLFVSHIPSYRRLA